MKVSIKEKIKTNQTNIDSAFLKSDTVWNELILEDIIPRASLNIRPSIKIKIEVDTEPPLGFETEEKLLLQPFSFYVKCFKLSDSFAGKMHALLFRKWKQRVKGRDWYDMEWYIKRKTPLNLNHFLVRALDSGDWKEKTITKEQFLQLLKAKIESISFKSVLDDVLPFVQNNKDLDIWSADYFKKLSEKMAFK